MSKKLLWIVLPLAAAWVGAQVQGARGKALAEIAPANALVWIEARNFNGILASWDASAEKKTWLESAPYQSYIRSKLALRLEEVKKAYADGVGVNPGYELLTNLAGGESAAAVYDVGELELLYLTRLPGARIANNLLMQGRARFQARNAGGQAYYVKASSDGAVAFAAVGDLLIAGTREDLVAGALQALAGGQQRPSLAQERWFADATSKGVPGSDVRLVVNLERAVKTPHFRSYWIQQNISEMAKYYASVSDLRMGAAAWTEQRALLRREASAAVDDAGVAKLARLIPADAGFYQAWAKPSKAQVEALLAETILPRGAGSGGGDPDDRRAPQAPLESASGGEEQIEDRVDLEDAGPQAAAAALPIIKLAAASLDAAAKVQATRLAPGGVMVTVDSAVALLGSANWDVAAVRASERFAGLAPLRVWTQGNLLVISNSQPLLDRMTASANASPLSGAYVAGYRHGAESDNYARMMRLIDYPQIPQSEAGSPRAPMLFSETLAGVGRVLRRVDAATFEAKDDGAVLRQTVTYRKRP